MSEIAARWVSIYPRIANGFAGEINTSISRGLKSTGAPAGQVVGQNISTGIATGVTQSGSKFSAAMQGIAGKVLAGGAVATVASFVKGSVQAFSDLEDATGAASVVFGDSMDKIIAQSETAAKTMGMSKAQVIDASNTFGTLGKSASLTGDDLADFSVKMTQIAGDLSSFKGGSPEEAVLAVGAALRGESEPIRRYGVLLDDATLKARAMKMGLIATTKEALTPQNRVLAAQAEILAQTTDAQGDFARTAGSTANVAKTLAAETENLTAELGEQFAPSAINAQRALSNLLAVAEDGKGALGPTVEVVQALTGAISDLTSFTKDSSDPLVAFIGQAKEAFDRITGLWYVQQGAAAYTDWRDAQADSAAALEKVASMADRGAERIPKVTAAAESGTDAWTDYATAIKETYNAQLSLRDAERAAEAAIDDATKQLWESAGVTDKMIDKNGKLTAEGKKLVKAYGESGKALDTNTDAGRNNEQALDAIAKTTLAAIAGMTDLEKANGTAAERADRGREEFVKLAKQFGVGAEEAEALADQMGLLKSKEINFTVKVAWKGNLSKEISVDGTGAGKIALRASGGPISGGIRGRDSVPALLMPDEHVLTTSDVRALGGHDGVFRMRALAQAGVLRFAAGGPVMPSYKGHSLDWWEDYLLTDLEMTRLQIRIKDLKSDLSARETYNPPGKKKKATRQKLRGLERKEAQLELKDAEEQLRLARDAAKANSSKSGSIAAQIAKYEADMDSWEARQDAIEEQVKASQSVYDTAAAIWQSAASSLSKSGGISLDKITTSHTNAVGDIWSTSREVTAADLAAKVGQQASQVETFIGLLDQLRKAGASEALISDVMALGTVEGTKAARMYLADRASLSIANSAYDKLAASQARLEAIGNQVGTAAVSVTINEAATPEATKQAVLNAMLAGR